MPRTKSSRTSSGRAECSTVCAADLAGREQVFPHGTQERPFLGDKAAAPSPGEKFSRAPLYVGRTEDVLPGESRRVHGHCRGHVL